MSIRYKIHVLSAALLLAAGLSIPDEADAQISGRVILQEGPIGVDVVFGPRPSVVVEYGERPRYQPRAPRYRERVVEVRRPVRYHRGMTLVELERYLDWVEAEYRYFKRIHPDEAYYELGWTERELDRYVDWLKDERRFLKRERKELRKLYRQGRGWDRHDWDDDWDDDDRWERDDDRREDRGRRGRGRGRGR
ncbi:MAG: hypothetical protein R3253_14620 [Longimicrobiales bacterium]|nr:hypothetical protein [Longimicrobiales bacterium]